MKVPGRMSKPATNSPHCQVSRGGGRIDWLFSRIKILVYLHLVVFLNPYFLGVNACISKYMWYCMYFQQKSTYKHTPCYRPPSHRWARRRWSQRSQVQCPRNWWCALRKPTFTRGLNPPSTSSIFAQACRKPGVNFKRKPCDDDDNDHLIILWCCVVLWCRWKWWWWWCKQK